MLGRLLPAPRHVLCSRHGWSSPRRWGCSLVAGLALHHGAAPVFALHCLQLRLKALQPPVLHVLCWLQVVAHGAIGLVRRGGRWCQAQLRLLQDGGHKELPRRAVGVRAQGSDGGWLWQGWGGVLTLELGVEETLLRSTSLKAPSDWSDIWREGGQEETTV